WVVTSRFAGDTPGSSTVTVSVSSPSTTSTRGIQLPATFPPSSRSSRLSNRRLISLWIRATSSMEPMPFVIGRPSFPRVHEIAQLRHELLDVLELPVDRGEADVGDLVQFLQAIH